MLIVSFVSKSSALLSRIAFSPIAAARAVTRAALNRRAVLQLTELDDRNLKDIGLIRSDVEGALANSWFSDPSIVLSERSAKRSGNAAEATRAKPSGPAPQAKRPAAAADPIACGA